MRKLSLFLLISTYFLVQPSFSALEPEKQLYSPTISEKFYHLAQSFAESARTAKDKTSHDKSLQAAMLFTSAASQLDESATNLASSMIDLLCQTADPNQIQRLVYVLDEYVTETSDLAITFKSVDFMLANATDRQHKEQILTILFNNIAPRNNILQSTIAVKLAAVAMEIDDKETAKKYLISAYNSDKYNAQAFEQLVALGDIELFPELTLERLRFSLGANPLSFDRAISYAKACQDYHLYSIAAVAYQYCDKLYNYLHRSAGPNPDIYLPKLLCLYHSPYGQNNCLSAESELSDSGRFDLLARSIAAEAAKKSGALDQYQQILRDIESHIAGANSINAAQASWFYCFISPDPAKAMNFANKAYSSSPESSDAIDVLSYAAILNNQQDLASTLLSNHPATQITDLVQAKIAISKNDNDQAIVFLKNAIDKQPHSLVSLYCKTLLGELGSEYLLSFDPDMIAANMSTLFENPAISKFTPAESLISLQLNTKKFINYNSRLDATISISNNSLEPLLIKPDAFFSGAIRIDAKIGGDLDEFIPSVLSTTIYPSKPIDAGQGILTNVDLLRGRLGEILTNYPQANLTIELTTYLDPMTLEDGTVKSKLGLAPVKTKMKRPAVKLSTQYLQNRFELLKTGKQGQKLQVSKLFSCLLLEQNALADKPPLYRFMYADWMGGLLKSGLIYNVNSDDWVTSTSTICDIMSLPVDYDLLRAASSGLNRPYWPARLASLCLLSKNRNQSFAQVLNHIASNDNNLLVREFAILYGGVQETVPESATVEITEPLLPNDVNQPTDSEEK